MTEDERKQSSLLHKKKRISKMDRRLKFLESERNKANSKLTDLRKT